MTFIQKQRLEYIEFLLMFLGTLRRSNLVEKYSIGSAAASRDIALYKELAPSNIEYNTTDKTYSRLETFTPLFVHNALQTLTKLTSSIEHPDISPYVVSDRYLQLNHPSIDIVSVISRAIKQGKVISIEYSSFSSGRTVRKIVPGALVNNGLRWHVRAYDRKRERFTDFVLTRIQNPRFLEDNISQHEMLAEDIQWNRIVELEVVPHPSRDNPETAELDYSMQDGALNIKVRAALAGYVLRLWNVDCSDDHSLTGNEYQLWLRNSLALYGVENLSITPGYNSHT
jgi:hypothetical protein